MMKYQKFFLLCLILFFVSLFNFKIAQADVHTCDSCDSCNAQIAAAASGDTVQPTNSIEATTSSCINFDHKSNVTFDCLNNTISGPYVSPAIPPYTFGIDLSSSSDNNVIRNCIVTNFYGNIRVSGQSNSFENVWSFNAFQNGFYFSQSSNNRIENSEAYGNGASGIYFYDSCSSNTVTSTSVGHNSIGVSIDYSSGNTLDDVDVMSNQHGVAIAYSENNTVKNSRLEHNDPNGGIYLPPGWQSRYSKNNYFYNNFFSNAINLNNLDVNNQPNYLNTTLDCSGGSNKIGAPCIGGNYWDSNGYSDTCLDNDSNGICDSSFTPSANNVDNYPLSSAIDNTAPTTPQYLFAQPLSAFDIVVSWEASEDNLYVSGYEIYRDGVQIGTTTESYFDDTGLFPSTNYTYAVMAFDPHRNVSAATDPYSAQTLASSDIVPPAAPSGLDVQ